MLAASLTPSLDEKVSKIFDIMDADGNGTVEMLELKTFLKAEKNKNYQALLVGAMRQDKKEMSLDEFRSFIMQLQRSKKYTDEQLETTLVEIIEAHSKPKNAPQVLVDDAVEVGAAAAAD